MSCFQGNNRAKSSAVTARSSEFGYLSHSDSILSEKSFNLNYLDEEKVEKRRSPQPSISRMSQHLLIEKSLIESTPIIPLKSDCVGSSGNASDTLSIDSSNSVGKKQGEKAGPHHRRTKRQRLHDSAASQSPSAPENHVVDCPTPPAATTSRRNGSTKHSSMELDRSSSHSNSVTKEKDHHGGKQKLKPRRKRKV